MSGRLAGPTDLVVPCREFEEARSGVLGGRIRGLTMIAGILDASHCLSSRRHAVCFCQQCLRRKQDFHIGFLQMCRRQPACRRECLLIGIPPSSDHATMLAIAFRRSKAWSASDTLRSLGEGRMYPLAQGSAFTRRMPRWTRFVEIGGNSLVTDRALSKHCSLVARSPECHT